MVAMMFSTGLFLFKACIHAFIAWLTFLERSLTSYRFIVISTKFSSNVIVRKVQFHN